MEDPFTTTFGIVPKNIISRLSEFDMVKNSFLAERPNRYLYLITGLRGSGKSVLLSCLFDYFSHQKNWIVLDCPFQGNLIHDSLIGLCHYGLERKMFVESELEFTTKIVNLSLKKKPLPSNDYTDYVDLMTMFKKKGKRVLLTIDEIDASEGVKQFFRLYQSLIRQNMPIFLLMTGVYENVQKIKNEPNLTFLWRTPRINLGPLDIQSITNSYQSVFNISFEQAAELALMTKGFAYAYQVLGSILFEEKVSSLTAKVLSSFDSTMAAYVYDKVFYAASALEKKVLKSFKTNEPVAVRDIIERSGISEGSWSQIRARLIEKGLVSAPSFGKLVLTLPRFNEYLYFH